MSQSFFELDRKTIRGNCNIFILFKLPRKDISLIHQDLLSNTIEKDDFDILVNNHYKEKYKYLVYNKDEDSIIKNLFH